MLNVRGGERLSATARVDVVSEMPNQMTQKSAHTRPGTVSPIRIAGSKNCRAYRLRPMQMPRISDTTNATRNPSATLPSVIAMWLKKMPLAKMATSSVATSATSGTNGLARRRAITSQPSVSRARKVMGSPNAPRTEWLENPSVAVVRPALDDLEIDRDFELSIEVIDNSLIPFRCIDPRKTLFEKREKLLG